MERVMCAIMLLAAALPTATAHPWADSFVTFVAFLFFIQAVERHKHD